jgi:hypothetical protein
MKIKLKKSVVIKLTIILMLVIAAPFLVPFVAEFLAFTDLMELEALILFLAYQSRHALAETTHRFRVSTVHLTKTLVNLSTV